MMDEKMGRKSKIKGHPRKVPRLVNVSLLRAAPISVSMVQISVGQSVFLPRLRYHHSAVNDTYLKGVARRCDHEVKHHHGAVEDQ